MLLGSAPLAATATPAAPPARPPTTRPNVLAAAIHYAGRGWRIVPLQWRRVEHDGRAVCSCWRRLRGHDCGRRSCKHPLFEDWHAIASTDVELIAKWWTVYPIANLGLATGWQCNGLYLIAVDEDRDGALAELAAAHGETVPLTWAQTTGRGRHYLFVVPAELMLYVDAIRNRTKLVDGLDIRASGGLIVMAPSISLSGVTYTVTHDVEPAPIPAWLFWSIANKRPRSANTNPSAARPSEAELPVPLAARIADGIERCKRHPPAIDGNNGDATTFELVLHLVRGLVLPPDAAFDLLWKVYNPTCVGPWTEHELKHKIEWAENDARMNNVPWAYLLPPPAEVNVLGEEAEPNNMSPSVSPLLAPNATAITLTAQAGNRAEAREIATVEFIGIRRTHDGKHGLRIRVLDGAHVGAEIPWWLDWPATPLSANRWHHIAIALGLDEVRDPLRDTYSKRARVELVTKATGAVVPRRAYPL